MASKTENNDAPNKARLSHDGQRFVLDADDGRTTVEEIVVAKIAGVAAREVEGVHSLVPFDMSQRLTSVARSATGRRYRALGVQVHVGTVEAAIDVRMTAGCEERIPQLADRVRRNVIERVEHATGLSVKRVDIDVVGLDFPVEEPIEPAPETPELA